MTAGDQSPPAWVTRRQMATLALRAALAVVLLAAFAGCDQFMRKDAKDVIAEGDRKVSSGDFQGAIRLYESALDGTPQSADAHYKLALVYMDKLKNPRDAVHHFGRYLAIAPSGSHAADAKRMRAESDKRAVAAAGDVSAPMSQAEAARLKNENASLRAKLADAISKKAATPPPNGKPDKVPPGSRSHVVQPGETLAAIAQKYYRNRNRAKDILDANFNSLNGKTTIKPGQTLIIP